VVVALEAMATRFVLSLWDDIDEARLRAGGEAALAGVARWEERLSRFRPGSEISQINRSAGRGSVRVSPPVFDLLERCRKLHRATGGAFDPTVGPLMRAYGFRAGGACGIEAAAAARVLLGMERVDLDPATRTVGLPVAGMELDLGAIGKGAAVDTAIAILQECGIDSALLDGGTSCVHAVGAAPDGAPWRIGWRVPGEAAPRLVELSPARPALAVSASHGRTADGGAVGHVLDPVLGGPADAALTALVTGPGSTVCDALATALLVLGPAKGQAMLTRFPGYVGFVAPEAAATGSGS
jgi:thiamine biosynthesis lipoprotein